MANTITTVVNTDFYGIAILVTIDGSVLSGHYTVIRHSPAGSLTVRGMDNIAVTTDTVAMVDIEVPFVDGIYYELKHTPDDPDPVTHTLSTPLADGWWMSFPTYVLRDLFEGESSIHTDFILGPIADTDTILRGGKFTVIGRPEPVIVVDVKEALESTIIFLVQTKDDILAMRTIVGAAHPLFLQSPSDLLLGVSGEGSMYFFAEKATESHIYPDGRVPTRKFTLTFTEISRPDAAVVFQPQGQSYDQVASTYDTYQDIIDADITYVNLVYGLVFGYL